MFTWHVPEFNDFKGTDLEPLAFTELQTSLQSFNLLRKTTEEVSIQYGAFPRKDAYTYAIQLFAAVHGIVALKNNSLLYYVHEDPDSVIDQLLQGFLSPLRPPGK